MKKKDMYVSPHIEVIVMENEGVIATSNLPGVGDAGDIISTRRGMNRGYGGASSNDLEDMINDILTIED